MSLGSLELLLYIHMAPVELTAHALATLSPETLPPQAVSLGGRIFSADIFCWIFGSLLPLQHFLSAGQGEMASGHPCFREG